MSMKPILFNTEMVRCLLGGTKTVTRRVVKPQPKGEVYKMPQGSAWPNYWGQTGSDAVFAPKYRPGDILYVRETWQHLYMPERVYIYKADSDGREELATRWKGDWRPSIHMPRKAARIFLRVTDVRVERLRDITEEQARKEGAEPFVCLNCGGLGCSDCAGAGYEEPAIPDFVDTWNNTIKPADRARYGWDANPWVWVIAFEQVGKREAQIS